MSSFVMYVTFWSFWSSFFRSR